MYIHAVIKSELAKLRDVKLVGVVELAAEAAKILTESGLAQERGTVTELPDERTVRYYITEGLIPPAEEKQGTASVYGYRHLLQLLVVKKLQSEHLPIRKIRDMVEGRSERELERFLGAEGEPAAKNEAMLYLEKLLTKPAHRPSSPPSVQAYAAPNVAASAPPSPQTSIGSAGIWSRIEIEPGLELHIHDQYKPPTDTRGLRRLTQILQRVIESYGQRPRK